VGLEKEGSVGGSAGRNTSGMSSVRRFGSGAEGGTEVEAEAGIPERNGIGAGDGDEDDEDDDELFYSKRRAPLGIADCSHNILSDRTGGPLRKTVLKRAQTKKNGNPKSTMEAGAVEAMHRRVYGKAVQFSFFN
jgi:hypothetical protein